MVRAIRAPRGTQGIVQGTNETLASLARQQGWGSLKEKFVPTAGLGGMGGTQARATFDGSKVGFSIVWK